MTRSYPWPPSRANGCDWLTTLFFQIPRQEHDRVVSGECAVLPLRNAFPFRAPPRRYSVELAIFAARRKKSKFIEPVQRVTNLDQKISPPTSRNILSC
jgi:hypothetical protein